MKSQMRFSARFRGSASLVAPAFVLCACAHTPVTISPQYEKPAVRQGDRVTAHAADLTNCRFAIAEVKDARTDPTSMGNIGGRPIRSPDGVAWLRSGLTALDGSHRLQLVSVDGNPQITLRAVLRQAYIISLATAKSANVVVSVDFDGKDDEVVERGQDEGTDWAAGEGEAQGALNRALTQVVDSIEHEMVTRCSGRRGDALTRIPNSNSAVHVAKPLTSPS